MIARRTTTTKSSAPPRLHFRASIGRSSTGLARLISPTAPEPLRDALQGLPGYGAAMRAINAVCEAEDKMLKQTQIQPVSDLLITEARHGRIDTDILAAAVAEATQTAGFARAQEACSTARNTLMGELESLLQGAGDGLRTHLHRRLTKLTARIAANVEDLRNARTAEQAIAAGVVTAYAEANDIAREYDELRVAQRIIDMPDGTAPVTHYPLAAILADPLAVWPLAVTPTIGRDRERERVQIHNGRHPWPDPNESGALAFLIWCHDHEAELWIPTADQLQAAEAKIAAAEREAQQTVAATTYNTTQASQQQQRAYTRRTA